MLTIFMNQFFPFFLQYEAIPESLKNMLLVMDTASVFGSRDDKKPTKLWVVTWDRIDAFLPELKNEVFKEKSPTPGTENT